MFDWAVSQAVTGVLQWLGTAIAVIGLPLTYLKSRKAASAAVKAADAVQKFQHRISTVTIAHSYSHLELAKSFISVQNYAAANSVVGILKRNVLQTAKWMEQAEDAPPSISQGRRNIQRVESQLALATRGATTFKPASLEGALRGLGECLIEWEQWVVTKTNGVE
jgi:hypothetical protein